MGKKLKIAIAAVLLSSFFVFLNLAGFSSWIRNFFYSMSSPFQKPLWQMGDSASDFFVGFLRANDLKKENEDLRVKINKLAREKIALKELGKENGLLRQALNLGLEKEFELKLVHVIGKDVFQDALTVNKGSADGVAVGLPVITSQKFLVGRIGEVYKNFSWVILISNKESFFDAKIGEKDAYGVIKGKGSSLLGFEFVPRDKKIEKGDFITTSSLGGVFPQDLLVGQVEGVNKSDVEPFQKIEVKPSFDLGEIGDLLIVTKF
ncbi:MAG: rod shape-determining protein MreC [bacterium]|nr:rod shape-determining protein MreC [bacterium]